VYDEAQPEYGFEKDEDFVYYLKFAHAQLKEILYRYTPLAGVWLDPIMGYYSRPDLFPIEQTYELIREAQPGVLLCFGEGASGAEDFVATEGTPRAHPEGGEIAVVAWEKNQGKPIEIRDTLQPQAWGYDQRAEGRHQKAGEVLGMLEHADRFHANLLLSSGLLPDGSVHRDDVETLLEVGERLHT
jgi:alpha-L-fucosidase